MFAGTLAQAPLGCLDRPLRPQPVPGHVALPALGGRARRGGRAGRGRARNGARNRPVARAEGAPARRDRRGRGMPRSCSSPARSRPPPARTPATRRKYHRLWRLQEAVFAHAVGTAIFGICFAFMLGYLVSRRSSAPRLLWLALGVLGLVGVQILIGAVQYHTHLPWWLVLIHVATAAVGLGRSRRARGPLPAAACLARARIDSCQWPTSSGFSSGRRSRGRCSWPRSAAGTTEARAPRSPAATSRRRGAQSASPRSIPRASSTSSRPGRTSRSWTG